MPPHIQMLPADTDVSTLSLLRVTDYCLTVRGTVGIEAARLGIPVLNAGGGRYDQRGFTMDPRTVAEYLEIIGRLETVPPLSAEQQELADRFAYGYLLLRPLHLTSVSFRFTPGPAGEEKRRIEATARIELENPEDWAGAPDIRAFADWVTTGRQQDFLAPSPPTPTSARG